MTNALETYLHEIGLVAGMRPTTSQHSDDAAAREDAVTSGQLQLQQQQHQQHPTMISSTKDTSAPPVAKFRSASDGTLIYTNPVIALSSVSGPSDLGPPYAAVASANYSSAGEPTYVHSTETTSWSNSRTFLGGDAIVNRHPNAVTTVRVSNNTNDIGTKSSHQNHPNVTQVSHVTSKLSSPLNTRQTVVQRSTNSYSLSRSIPQVTSQTSGGIPTTANPVTPSLHVGPNPLATAQAAAAISNSLNSKDVTQYIHTNDRSCLVDVDDRLSFQSPGVSGSDLSCDNSLVISIRQNLSDILHLNQTPFDQGQFNQSKQPTTFNRAHAFEDHCSSILPSSSQRLPADGSKRKEAELHEIVLSPSTLSTADSTPPLSQSSNVAYQNQPTLIKSSLKKEAAPNGPRKAVTFSASDLVHVEEYTISPAAPPHDLFLPFDRQLDNISENSGSVLFGGDTSAELWPPGTQENCHGSWFDSSTDAEPYLVDFPSPADETKDCAPLSFANDVFGRTKIFLNSGTFRPGESGKLNGKTISDLSGSHDHHRTLSTGTLSGIRSHRTLVKVNFLQGLLDINHNPGQTAEADSKAVQDDWSGIDSTLDYCRGIFHENLKVTFAATVNILPRLLTSISDFCFHCIFPFSLILFCCVHLSISG